MSEDTDLIGQIFGWVGTAICLYLYTSPAVPFIKVAMGKIDYKDSPSILLFCSFMNCVLWADYGLLKDKTQVYSANIAGSAITLIWLTIFLIFLGQKNFCFGLFLIILLMVLSGGIAFFFYRVLDCEITGIVAVVFNALQYGAPLQKIFTVFKTGKYELIPIFTSVGGFFCSSCWLIYGIYLFDINLIIPNGLGIFFAILQLIIYYIYYKKAKNDAEKFNDDLNNI